MSTSMSTRTVFLAKMWLEDKKNMLLVPFFPFLDLALTCLVLMLLSSYTPHLCLTLKDLAITMNSNLYLLRPRVCCSPSAPLLAMEKKAAM